MSRHGLNGCRRSRTKKTTGGVEHGHLTEASCVGFIAGAIAVFTVHDLIRYVLYAMGVFPLAPGDVSRGGDGRASSRQRHVLGRGLGVVCPAGSLVSQEGAFRSRAHFRHRRARDFGRVHSGAVDHRTVSAIFWWRSQASRFGAADSCGVVLARVGSTAFSPASQAFRQIVTSGRASAGQPCLCAFDRLGKGFLDACEPASLY